jgi:hypothetical protein
MSQAVIRTRAPADDLANHILSNLGMSEIDWLIIDPLSIGDAYQTLVLLPEFRRKHMAPGARLFYMCGERTAPIVPMFGAVDIVVGHRVDYNICYLFAERYGLAPGVPVVMGPAMHARGWLQRLMDQGLISVLHARKLILGLDLDCPIRHAEPSDQMRRDADETARAHGVEPGRSLLIVNHATSMKPLPVEAFADVIAQFPGPVFTDTTLDPSALIPGTKPIAIPLDQMIPIAEQFGEILALRSGIVDLISDARTRIFSIYPRPADAQTWVTDKQAWVNGYRSATLEATGLRGRAVERPILLAADDDVAAISHRIAQSFAYNGLMKPLKGAA